MTDVEPETDVPLAAEHISKYYGNVVALEDVSIQFRPGFNAIIGDNGAGKSTLLKIFSGVVLPDQGVVRVRGTAELLSNPRAARAVGIESLYQDLALVDTMSIAQNIFLGREHTRRVLGVRLVDRRRMRSDADEALTHIRIRMPGSRAGVKQLSGGQRQAVAIARAMHFHANVILLDEPTAALGPKETNAVLTVVKDMADHGETVVMVGHNLPQMLELADYLVIMRAGRVAARPKVSETSLREITEFMVGSGTVQ